MPADLSSFTLVCPGYRRAAGRLAFTVGSQIVAELDDTDLMESWEATQDLSPAEANALTEAAGSHLMELLSEGIDAVDIAEAVTDAAVVFLLAMKQHGIADPKRIPACTVKWSSSGETAHVCLAS